MNCTYVSDATNAGLAASNGMPAPTGVDLGSYVNSNFDEIIPRIPNSASGTNSSPVIVAAIVAAVLAVGDSFRY